MGPPRWHKESCQCRRCKFDPWVGKIPWSRKWQPIPVLLLGESHGQSVQLQSWTPLSMHVRINVILLEGGSLGKYSSFCS